MRAFRAVPGKGIVSSTVISSDSRKFSDYQNMKSQYPCMKSFKDRYKESGHIQDLIDDLESHRIEYSIYDDKQDNGCTIFYAKEVNSSTVQSSTYIVTVGDVDEYEVDADSEEEAIQQVIDEYFTDEDYEEYEDDPNYIWAIDASED